MSFFTWENRYALDIDSVDEDHRKLVTMIDTLYKALTEGEAKNVIQEIVDGLIDYSQIHFTREEEFMQKAGYKDIEFHKAAHSSFVERVKGFQHELKSGNDNITVDVITYLRDWLIVHILNADKKFAPDLKRYGIK